MAVKVTVTPDVASAQFVAMAGVTKEFKKNQDAVTALAKSMIRKMVAYQKTGAWSTRVKGGNGIAGHPAFKTWGEFTTWYFGKHLSGIKGSARAAVIAFMTAEGVQGKAIAKALGTSTATVSRNKTGTTGNGAGGARAGAGRGKTKSKVVKAADVLVALTTVGKDGSHPLANAPAAEQELLVAAALVLLQDAHVRNIRHQAVNLPAVGGRKLRSGKQGTVARGGSVVR